MAFSAQYVVESYADHLKGVGLKFWKHYQGTRLNQPESALAEAMVFRLLQRCQVDPTVIDTPGVGGPDFLCLQGKPEQFMVEATSLLPERVTKESSIPNRAAEEMEGGPIGLLTAQVDETATKKLHQVKKANAPVVLAVASGHFGSPILFDAPAAMNALISQPFWVAGSDAMSTDLKYSLFLRIDDGKVVIKNAEISAVLLLAIGADRTYVCGALHPAPKHEFKPVTLWEIPFAQLNDWPIKKSRLRTTWTLGTSPKPLEIPHKAII